jgi:hypothetical protein
VGLSSGGRPPQVPLDARAGDAEALPLRVALRRTPRLRPVSRSHPCSAAKRRRACSRARCRTLPPHRGDRARAGQPRDSGGRWRSSRGAAVRAAAAPAASLRCARCRAPCLPRERTFPPRQAGSSGNPPALSVRPTQRPVPSVRPHRRCPAQRQSEFWGAGQTAMSSIRVRISASVNLWPRWFQASESSAPRLDSSYTAAPRKPHSGHSTTCSVISSHQLSGGSSSDEAMRRRFPEQSGQMNDMGAHRRGWSSLRRGLWLFPTRAVILRERPR